MYWQPLYAFARRSGKSPHDAEDVTQEFFRSLMEKRWLADADREKGRLRSFLALAMKRFMANEWRREAAEKRGGGRAQVPIDTVFAESYYQPEVNERLAVERVFDREWAMTLLRLTMQRLQNEFVSAGKNGDFEVLKEFLTASHAGIDYRSAAEKLGINESAARVAVHRLRKRFREAYREEIKQTLPKGADVEEEIRYLADVLASG